MKNEMKKYVLFWINSNKGTHQKAVYELPRNVVNKVDRNQLKDILTVWLERWCSRFGAWTYGDNIIEYGYKVITIPKRKELLKAWDKLYARKHRLDDKYQTMQAMFNPQKFNQRPW